MAEAERGGDLRRGATLGRYVILAKIGAGAMGVVYAAYDPELGRKVAVKVVRDEGGDGDGGALGRQRLLREAQALARLAHPNVVAVHDVGALEGGIFLAMELVAGRTLQAWLAERPRARGEILETFRSAGAGLAAAHARGLVHRDFKPQNVLVGDDGRARVVDFGLARRARGGGGARPELASLPAGEAALDAELTFPGELLGTPRYMAPEQYGTGEVGPAADQFAFCVALYAALYGEPPFDEAAPLPALLFSITGARVREAPKASRVPPRLRRALLRGLAADPAARFPSMEALLRELAHDPSRARRAWVAGGAAAVLAAAAGLGLHARSAARGQLCTGAERHLVGVWDEARRGAVREALVSSPRPFARDTWSRLEPLLDGYARAWAAQHAGACEATRVRGEQSERALDLRMACLRRRRDDLRALTDVLAADPAAAAEKAVEAAHALGDVRECADVPALERPESPPASGPGRAKFEAVSAELSGVKARLDTGRYNEALRLANEALSKARELGYKPTEAQAFNYLGALKLRLGDGDGAQQAYMGAVAAGVAGHDDAQLARAAAGLARTVGVKQRRFDEGLAWARFAHSAAERAGNDDALVANVLGGEGAVLAEQGNYDEARRRVTRALELLGSVATITRADAAVPFQNLGILEQRQENHDAAYARALETYRFREQTLGPGHPSTANALEFLANCEITLRRYDDGLRSLRRALAIQEAELGARHEHTASTVLKMGLALFLQGRDAEAMPHYQRAREVFDRPGGPTPPEASTLHMHVGVMHLRAGRTKDALRELAVAKAMQAASGSFERAAFLELVRAKAFAAAGDLAGARRVEAQARRELPAGRVAEAEAWVAARGLGRVPKPAKRR